MSLKYNEEDKRSHKYVCSKCGTKYYGLYGCYDKKTKARLDGLCHCSTRDDIGWLIDIKTREKAAKKRTQSMIDDELNQLTLF